MNNLDKLQLALECFHLPANYFTDKARIASALAQKIALAGIDELHGKVDAILAVADTLIKKHTRTELELLMRDGVITLGYYIAHVADTLNPTKTTITIVTDHGRISIRAIVRNGIALHPYTDTDGWTVTHIASGYQLNWQNKPLPLGVAKAYFRDLRNLACWHYKTADAIPAHERREITALASKYGVSHLLMGLW